MLSIIAGKPGQGKSFHMMMLLVTMLTDWLRYELKHGKPFDSSIWINIRVLEEGLNETVSHRVGQKVDAWKYIHFCDPSFFNDSECTYWWSKFPPKSVIVIDEVHQYLGKKIEFGSLDLEQELINWISTHRHNQQEIYFISQHTDQFARQVLGIADKLLEIVNVKSLELPWPISVPMQDIYDLKSAFGIKTQYYQANVGNFRGKAIRWGGATHRHMMSPDIFRVYKSHNTDTEESDRPSLNLTKWEAVKWFLGRHGWHLIPKIGGILAIPYIAVKILLAVPVLLMDAAGANAAPKSEPPAATETLAEKTLPAPTPARIAGAPLAGVPPARVAFSATEPESIPMPVPMKQVKMVMLFNGGVILDDGRKIAIGETFNFEEKTETLACACAACGVIGFESGKRVRF